jgi:hypothetical protein
MDNRRRSRHGAHGDVGGAEHDGDHYVYWKYAILLLLWYMEMWTALER